ncbi:MAG: lysylphosphatidylglycerol synthase transmembrane domain-containing protein [Planctomycetota bacterium]
MANEQKKKSSSHVSLILRLGVAALACWLIVKDLDFAELKTTFANFNVLWLLLSCLIFMLGVALIGLRWWLFMRAQKIPVPPFMAVKLTFLGQFFTNFMPSAVGGDLIRAWYVSRYSHKKLQAALGVLVDRVMGLASTFILAISGYWLFMRGQGLLQIERKGGGAIRAFLDKHPVSWPHFILLVIILSGCWLFLNGLFDIKSLIKKVYSHVVHVFKQFKEVMLVYYHHPLLLVAGLMMTICIQSVVILSYWLIGRDLGMEAAIRYYFVFFPMIWVIGSIPISIGGLGILEGGLVVCFVQFTGAAPEQVIALALCQRLTWIAASIPGMIVHLTGAHRREPVSC